MAKNAIILAAGEGSRLRPLTEAKPKCLVEVNGVPILHNALEALAAEGCSEVRIVAGYKADYLRQQMGERYEGIALHYIFNEIWATTNSMYSLRLGLEQGSADYVLEGDVFFERSLLQLPSNGDIAWLADFSYRSSDGSYLKTSMTRRVTSVEIVKDPTKLDASWGKSVGILRLTTSGSARLKQWLCEATGKERLYYDMILAEHLEETAVQSVDISPFRWYEIDTVADLAAAEKIFT